MPRYNSLVNIEQGLCINSNTSSNSDICRIDIESFPYIRLYEHLKLYFDRIDLGLE